MTNEEIIQRNKVIDLLNNECCSVSVEKSCFDGYAATLEVETSTPLGEDWIFSVDIKSWSDLDIKRAFALAYRVFDVDDECEHYIANRGKNGVPDSVRDILEDQEWKDKFLSDLSDAIDKEFEKEE